jgi:hypothetical protein
MTVEYHARGLTLTLTISVDADIRGNAVGAWGNCLCINSCRPAIFARNFLPIAQSWFREHDEACQVDRGDNVRRFHGVTPGWRGHFKRGQSKSQKGPPDMERGQYRIAQVSRDKVEYEGHVKKIFGEQSEMDF